MKSKSIYDADQVNAALRGCDGSARVTFILNRRTTEKMKKKTNSFSSLPSASEGWGKVLFSVCLSVQTSTGRGRGVPQVWDGGGYPRSGWGGTPDLDGGGYPRSGW